MDKIRYSQEWIKQADYDLDTARIMLDTGRYIYCVFMCHLSVEKVLKAIYVKKLVEHPPRVHSLVFLAQRININVSQEVKEFLENLDEVSVPTRYPEELDKILKEYGKERTQSIFEKSKEVLECLKSELTKQ